MLGLSPEGQGPRGEAREEHRLARGKAVSSFRRSPERGPCACLLPPLAGLT